MKFTVSSSDLLTGLMSVSKVIVPKPANSILENFLFELKGAALAVTASDGETTLKTSIPIAQIEKEGAIAVRAKLLTDSLKEFPDQPLTFNTDDSNSWMDIIWESGASKIPCHEAADFPELPVIDKSAESIVFEAPALLDGITNTIYATAEDELRPVMNGILFDIDVDSITLVSSDAHKLISHKYTQAKAGQKSSFILHKKPAAILRGLLAKADETVSIKFDSKNAYFNFGSNMLVCRLIEGNYPAYKTVIPKNNFNKLVIGRGELLNVVKRVAVCSNQDSGQIKMKLTMDQLLVSAQDLAFAMSAHEMVNCQYDGQEMEIGFKAPFLLEILNNIPYQNICIELADPTRAALIVSADAEDSDYDIKALLMPVMINA